MVKPHGEWDWLAAYGSMHDKVDVTVSGQRKTDQGEEL